MEREIQKKRDIEVNFTASGSHCVLHATRHFFVALLQTIISYLRKNSNVSCVLCDGIRERPMLKIVFLPAEVKF